MSTKPIPASLMEHIPAEEVPESFRIYAKVCLRVYVRIYV